MHARRPLAALFATVVLAEAFRPSSPPSTAATRKCLARPLAAATTTQTEKQPWILNPQYDYDQDRDWGFVYSSVPPEASASYPVLDIEGTIPADLYGTTYYKIGPGKFERNGRAYKHVLDGDGFVVRFHIDRNDGSVHYTGRFVETEYYQREERTNQICFRNVFGTQRPGGPLGNALDLTLKNVANTNVLAWGGRLFALWEAGRPYELDPVTLETLPLVNEDGPFADIGALDCNLRGVTLDEGGPTDQLVKVGRFFTAHPHILDEDTLVVFTAVQNPKKDTMDMEFLEYDKEWKVKRRLTYAVPEAVSAPHDFAVGNEFYGFIQNNIQVDTLPYLLGLKGPAQVMQLQLKENSLLHLVPRDKKGEAVTVELPPYFAIHNLARLEETDDAIIMYSNGWDLQDTNFFPATKDTVPFLSSWSGRYPDFDVVTPAKFFKTIVNRQTGKLVSHQEIIPKMVMEFQSQDEREPKFSYISLSTYGGESLPGVGLARVDTHSQTAEHWWAEPKIFTGEMVPVPKQNKDKGSWLVGLIYDAEKRRSSLTILDSERFSDGPVARIHLPHHISYGLHSTISRD